MLRRLAALLDLGEADYMSAQAKAKEALRAPPEMLVVESGGDVHDSDTHSPTRTLPHVPPKVVVPLRWYWQAPARSFVSFDTSYPAALGKGRLVSARELGDVLAGLNVLVARHGVRLGYLLWDVVLPALTFAVYFAVLLAALPDEPLGAVFVHDDDDGGAGAAAAAARRAAVAAALRVGSIFVFAFSSHGLALTAAYALLGDDLSAANAPGIAAMNGWLDAAVNPRYARRRVRWVVKELGSDGAYVRRHRGGGGGGGDVDDEHGGGGGGGGTGRGVTGGGGGLGGLARRCAFRSRHLAAACARSVAWCTRGVRALVALQSSHDDDNDLDGGAAATDGDSGGVNGGSWAGGVNAYYLWAFSYGPPLSTDAVDINDCGAPEAVVVVSSAQQPQQAPLSPVEEAGCETARSGCSSVDGGGAVVAGGSGEAAMAVAAKHPWHSGGGSGGAFAFSPQRGGSGGAGQLHRPSSASSASFHSPTAAAAVVGAGGADSGAGGTDGGSVVLQLAGAPLLSRAGATTTDRAGGGSFAESLASVGRAARRTFGSVSDTAAAQFDFLLGWAVAEVTASTAAAAAVASAGGGDDAVTVVVGADATDRMHLPLLGGSGEDDHRCSREDVAAPAAAAVKQPRSPLARSGVPATGGSGGGSGLLCDPPLLTIDARASRAAPGGGAGGGGGGTTFVVVPSTTAGSTRRRAAAAAPDDAFKF